ncbi:MAG: response regulator [Bacteroidetes bacterium]|nr:response regulator [Bacteroidota bacterium]
MKKALIGSVFGMAAIIPLLLVAQSSTLSVTQQRGLSNNSVTGLHQDRDGFLWIATRDGLNKFDGYRVTVFRTRDQFEAVEGDNMFEALTGNGGDSLFLAVGRQVLAFNRLSLQFSEVPVSIPDTTAPRTDVRTIVPDGKKGLWVGTFSSGLLYHSFQTGTTTHFFDTDAWKQTVVSNNITAILPAPDGTLWLGSIGGGLLRFSPDRKTITPFSWKTLIPEFSYHQSIRSLAWKNTHTLYVGTWGYGLKTFDIRTGQFSDVWEYPNPPEQFPFNDIRFIHVDTDESVWFGTNGGGLFHLGPDGRVRDQFAKTLPGLNNLADNDVHAIFKERPGVYWVGTDGAGVQGINLNFRLFRQDQTSQESAFRLTNPDVHELFLDSENRLWVGTNGGGINVFSEGSRQPFVFESSKGDQRKLLDNTVYTIAEDAFGRFWIGTNSGGVQIWNPATRQFTNLRDRYKRSISLAYTIFADSRGDVWFSTYSGNFRYKNPGPDLDLSELDGQTLASLNHTFIQDFHEDKAGYLWMGTNAAGVVRLNYLTNRLERLDSLITSGTARRPQNITGMAQDRWGRLWMACSGSGLFVWSPLDGSLKHLTTADGLIHDNLMDCLLDRDGNIWISTPVGLSRISFPVGSSGKPGSLSIRNFDANDGIRNEMFNRFAAVAGPDGRLWFGGTDGITSVNTKDLSDANLVQAPVYLTGVSVNAIPYPDFSAETGQSINHLKELQFTAEDFLVSVEVASLQFSRAGSVHYSYQLEGFKQDWIQLGTRRLITFASLPAGSYRLNIRTTDEAGHWTPTQLSIPVEVHPPVYATWWARVLQILLLAGLLSWVVVSRLSRVKREKRLLEQEVTNRTHQLQELSVSLRESNEQLAHQTEKLRQLDQKKSDFFTNIAHEFRTPLTLILGPLEKQALKKNDPDTTLMIRNARRLKRLIDQLLAISKADSGELPFRPSIQNFTGMVRAMTSEFANLAAMKKREVSYTGPEEDLWFSFDPDHLEKMLANLLSNALKFTREGDEIRVDVKAETTQNPPVIHLSVEDSGIGIAPGQQPFLFDRFYQVETGLTRSFEGSGIGLALVKELVTLHGGTISVYSYPGAGSRFTITLPVREQTAAPAPSAGTPFSPTPLSVDIPDLIDVREDSPEASPEADLPRKETILVVEDNADLQVYLSGLLEGFAFKTANDGAEGLQMALSSVPDLIISDVMMPVMNGYDLLKALKTERATSHIPVIMLTAKSSLDSKLIGLETGADAYLGKPFQAEELLAIIRNLLKSRDRLRTYYTSLLAGIGTAEEVSAGLPVHDQDLLDRLLAVIDEEISNPDLSVDMLAKAAFLSQSQLNRKLNALTGNPANHLIRTRRMQIAKALLMEGNRRVNEVAWEVGIPNLAYFSKLFRDTHGQSPSDLLSS